MRLHRRVTGWWAAGASLALIAASGLGAYAISREFDNNEGRVSAEGVPRAQATPPTLPASPVATVDTSKPQWYVPYLDEDAAKPRVNQTVNGLTLGPTVERSYPEACLSHPAKQVPSGDVAARVAGTVFARVPTNLPSASFLENEEVIDCGGRVVVRLSRYRIPGDEASAGKVARGEMSWFGSPHGGAVDIMITESPLPQFPSDAASSRWSPVVGRLFTAVAPAVLDELGHSTYMAWKDGILVVVEGTDLDTSSLVAIGEALQ